MHFHLCQHLCQRWHSAVTSVAVTPKQGCHRPARQLVTHSAKAVGEGKGRMTKINMTGEGLLQHKIFVADFGRGRPQQLHPRKESCHVHVDLYTQRQAAQSG